MNFFKAATMSAPLLEISAPLWGQLIEHLRKQGAGVRESGAFLLGHKSDNGRVITHFLPYEWLQADALNNDYVSLTAASFAKLWDLCRSENLSVVADVHTHRFGPGQSRSDKANPMVALRGHIALIVPRFAQGTIRPEDLGFYVYQGSHAWVTHSGAGVSRVLCFSQKGTK
jgi:proteasome lid subunit RPN8/RPN11